eukprot:2266189-Alexandrium_andersonii.AAC.1
MSVTESGAHPAGAKLRCAVAVSRGGRVERARAPRDATRKPHSGAQQRARTLHNAPREPRTCTRRQYHMRRRRLHGAP